MPFDQYNLLNKDIVILWRRYVNSSSEAYMMVTILLNRVDWMKRRLDKINENENESGAMTHK